jgi:hypothetical protein
MPPGIGYSYAPGSDIQMNGQNGNGSAPSRLSPQQAVKVLSLRVPQTLPSNAPVNRQLLTSPGGAAAGASGLQSMIQQLMQAFKPQASPQQALAGQPPPLQAPAQQAMPTPHMLPTPPDGGPTAPAGGAPSPFLNPTIGGGGSIAGGLGFGPSGGGTSWQPPQPMESGGSLAPKITWGDELQTGNYDAMTLGQNPDELAHWQRMFGPAFGAQWPTP